MLCCAASALNQRDCPVLHLTGDFYMFSLYEIGDFLLAFYTDIPSGPFSAIEVVDSNDSIFEIGKLTHTVTHTVCIKYIL
jgi:hypothetical protein